MTDPAIQVLHVTPADEDTVLVVFSAVGARKGFHLFPLLNDMPGFSKLFVRDPKSRWYNAGLPGVGNTVEEIAAWLELEISQLGAKRVITVGPSMGAYAAILFGCMIGAERAIAFAPQTLLDPGLRHSPPEDVCLQAPDLEPIIRAAPRTQIDVIAGWDDHVDVFHAQRIAELPSVRVLALKNRLHRFGVELSREGQLVPFVEDLLEARAPEICEVDPHVEPDVEKRIADTVYAVERRDWRAVEESIRAVAERYPGWAGPNFDLARALAGMGDWPGAEAFCLRAMRANPRWPEPRAQLVKILLEQGQPEKAKGAAQKGLAEIPDWANGYLLLARCFSQLGHDDEARTCALRAAELKPDLAGAAEAFADGATQA